MPSLTAAELTSMRTEVVSFFDQLLDVYRGTAPADDAYGGREGGTPTLHAQNIKCEVYPGAAHIVDMPDEAQLVNTQMYTVTVPVGTDIQKGDQVVITTAGNLKLNVTVILDPQSQELQMQFLADKEVLNG
jgi:hypothetical protein